MIRHFLATTFRHFYRTRAFSLINIAGLAIGITVAMLLFFWMKQESSFDQFHKNKHRIYRLITGEATDENAWVGTPALLAYNLSQIIPEIESYVRLDQKEAILQANKKTFNEKNIFLVDSNFFQVFSFELLSGTPESVLRDPYSIVLTQSMAKKYFGELNPVGQTMRFDNTDLNITGIACDPPFNSHFHFNALVRFDLIYEKLDRQYMECWGCYNFTTYLLVNKLADPQALESKIRKFSVDWEGNTRTFERLTLQPLTDIHFEYIRGNVEPSFNRKYIVTYSALICIILVMAWINYINLNIAIAPLRFKEVGIKKTFGAGRIKLTTQFIAESIIATLIALFLAGIMTEILIPYFNQLLGKHLQFQFLDPEMISAMLIIAIIIGFLIGIYPALFTSSVPVSRVLKGIRQSGRKSWFRNTLVVFQFTISIFFILFAFILNKQLHYIRNKDLGFDRDHILSIRFFPVDIKTREDGELYRNKTIHFKNICSNYTTVSAASVNNFTPSTLNRNHGVTFEGQRDDQHFSVFVISGDKDFIRTYGIEMISSSDKIDHFEFNSTYGYILNESAVKAIGWDQAMDNFFSIFGPDKPGKVIGVCKDFHYRSFHHKIGPSVIILGEPGLQVSFRINGNPEAFISYAKKEYKQIFPDLPFEYIFFDQDFDKLYKSDFRTIRAISLFTIIAIVIACLGLYGLASFYTVQRTKEIGIRKVMGAAKRQIIIQFFREISFRIFIAILIATPIALILARNWLSNFVYKTQINWWILPLTWLGSIILAWFTISYQTLRAAGKNPVEILRYE